MAVCRLGSPIPEEGVHFRYWNRCLEECGGKLAFAGSLRESKSIGTELELPIQHSAGIKLNSSFTVCDETLDFTASSVKPIARAVWYAELYSDPQCRTKYKAIAVAEYGMFTVPSNSGEGDAVRLNMEVEVSPPFGPSYPLPADMSEIWEGFRLDTVLPCPEDGPLFPTRFEGSAKHIQALTNYIVDACAEV